MSTTTTKSQLILQIYAAAPAMAAVRCLMAKSNELINGSAAMFSIPHDDLQTSFASSYFAFAR